VIREKNITIVSITHDIEEAVKSDYVIVMDKGKVAMEGKPEEILLREKELIQMQLDIPFTLKLKNELVKQGVNVETNLKMEGMVDALCQLNLSK
jgi:energy-coupling factor transport system ATP-binding protein